MKQSYPQRNFRPWKANQERLTKADRLGLNVSELINEVLDKHFEAELAAKAQRIREAFSHPVR